MKVAWAPQPKQEIALVRLEDEILFGGARGGGKTDAGMAWLLYDIGNPLYRALVIRRNADDLKDWVDRAKRFFAPCRVVAAGVPTEFRFPSGAIIRTGHLKDSNAYTKYQGHEYQKIVIEEVTHIVREADYEKLLGSCRSTVPGIKPQIFCTTNPDGAGFEWVKERWGIPDQPTGITTSKDEGTGRTRVFIPSRVEDNNVLMQSDPGYVKFLDSIKDPTLRKQWRQGSWEEPTIEGSYYLTLMNNIRDKGQIRNVPYDPRLPVDTWWDIGIGDATAIWFTQVIGNEIRVIDYEEAEGEGVLYYMQRLKERGYLYRNHYWPHDGAVREYTTNVSRQETAESLGLTPIIIISQHKIDDGIQAARNIIPMCFFDQTKCKEGIKVLKNYKKEYDEKRDTFKDAPNHDWASHGADAFRYLAVGYGQYLANGTSNFKQTDYIPTTSYGI